ncbi:hypothetical protein TIFTF001_009632 [Ficus carica]|uniref:F-box domain-containing protein n=1 Tax=Ficus carica TaxID=3494 RepID=A0AA88A771_FICCA|nr:hypothetical protein TIFTF001_009632 [Ficus carica]
MHDGKGEDQEPNTAGVDRLSELPDNVIHYILSLVSTVDVVRMSILSKRWQRMWYSLPVLCFSDSADFGKSKSTKLCKFVGKCFTLRKNDLLNVTDTTITKVMLSTTYSWSRTCSWLRLVAKSNIKELDLDLPWLRKHRFPLELLCSKSLTHLRLSCVSFPNLHSASLPSLISLSLESLLLDDHAFHNLLLGCCSLEKLLIKYCHHLSNPKVSNSSLKFLEIGSSYAYDFGEMFRVDAINLESFICHGSRICCMSTLASCGKLRNLTFSQSRIKDQWLEDLIFRLPVLESLTLEYCNELRNIKICRSPSFKISMNVRSLVEANVTLSPVGHWKDNFLPVVYDTSWYTNLLYFLSNLDCSKNMDLRVYSEEALIFPDELRRAHDAPLPTVKHLKVTTCRSLMRNTDLQDSLFWALPTLETMRLDLRNRQF